MSLTMRSISRPLAVGALLSAAVLVSGCVAPSAAQQSAKPLTVAFIGDQGLTGNSRAVLRMIKQQGADMVLHQGDFDYRRDPDA